MGYEIEKAQVGKEVATVGAFCTRVTKIRQLSKLNIATYIIVIQSVFSKNQDVQRLHLSLKWDKHFLIDPVI